MPKSTSLKTLALFLLAFTQLSLAADKPSPAGKPKIVSELADTKNISNQFW